MKQMKLMDTKTLVASALEDIRNGSVNPSGEYMSSYYVLAEDEDQNTASISITLDYDDEYEHRWYTIHLIDDITGKDAELFSTDGTDQAELESLVKSLQDELCSSTKEGSDSSDIAEDEPEFSSEQLEQLDCIDNAAYQLILALLGKTEDEFDWDMHYIGEVVEEACSVLGGFGFEIKRPVCITEADGTSHIEDVDRSYCKDSERYSAFCQGIRSFTAGDIGSFTGEISNETLLGVSMIRFSIPTDFNIAEVFGKYANNPLDGEKLSVSATYNIELHRVTSFLDVINHNADGSVDRKIYNMNDEERAIILSAMERHYATTYGLDLKDMTVDA